MESVIQRSVDSRIVMSLLESVVTASVAFNDEHLVTGDMNDETVGGVLTME